MTDPEPRRHARAFRYGIYGAIGLLVLAVLLYAAFFGPASDDPAARTIVVEPGSSYASVAAQVRTEGFSRSTLAMRIALARTANGRPVRPGAYELRETMDAWKIARTLATTPRMVFVTLPPAIRKEQIGDLLAAELGWGSDQRAAWDDATALDGQYLEGVYYPDTYLIPTDQSPAQIAARMRGRFMEAYQPFAAEALRQGLDLRTVLTLASIIDREAGATDKHLVSGILWNRLRVGMRLQADATLQYVRGEPGRWWPMPRSEDKFLESPFNTYKYAGLPPHPINNPSLASIAAALDPEETSCLYYLHTDRGRIHCARTYAEHKRNIDAYLR